MRAFADAPEHGASAMLAAMDSQLSLAGDEISPSE
jgi:hypothetical protein